MIIFGLIGLMGSASFNGLSETYGKDLVWIIPELDRTNSCAYTEDCVRLINLGT